MITKIQYSTMEERDNILTQNDHLILVAEHNITEGNFLVFSDEPLSHEMVYISVPEEDFTGLKQQIVDLEMAIASILGGAI